VVDAQGAASIAYQSGGGLALARESAQGWAHELVDAAAGVGGNASLALDAAGGEHVAYYDGTNGALRYARRGALGWSIDVVDDRFRSGQATALALDGGGHARIAYTFRGYTGGVVRFAAETATTAVGGATVDAGLAFAPPSPSPTLDGRATLSFRLESDEIVTFGLYNVAGRRVAWRDAESFAAGEHRVSWDAGRHPPGVYLLRLSTESGREARRPWVLLD
jgi:hypothetical protein